jgi:hypothetical protein
MVMVITTMGIDPGRRINMSGRCMYNNGQITETGGMMTKIIGQPIVKDHHHKSRKIGPSKET